VGAVLQMDAIAGRLIALARRARSARIAAVNPPSSLGDEKACPLPPPQHSGTRDPVMRLDSPSLLEICR
jgi:hypothetical protein